MLHHIPQWQTFKIKPLAKLLGFYIGPQAGSMMWHGPMTKYNDRINDMKKGSASIALNCSTYNTRIVPVSSYVSELVPLPTSCKERYGMFSALRLANCMRHSDFFELHKFGGPKLRSVSASYAAA